MNNKNNETDNTDATILYNKRSGDNNNGNYNHYYENH